jgi:serine protease Do
MPQGGIFMNEDDNIGQEDWYRAANGGTPPGRPSLKAPADAAPMNTPPLRSAGSPSSFIDPYWSARDPKPKKPGRNAIKIVTLCLSVLVLIIATALVFTNDGSGAGQVPDGSSAGSVEPTAPGSGEYDFREFFDDYYTPDETITGENTISRAETGTGVTLQFASDSAADELTLQEVYAKCAPAVVAITADVDDENYYWGSGVIMTSDGYIITNTHVLEGTNAVTVTLWDDSQYDAKLVGADAVSDIAVLKIEATGLTPAEFASSDMLKVGDRVIAIGNPLGEELRGTMTDGIISAINRDITYNGNTMTLLQTNAAINEGNSGGPLIDMKGEVVGITNMKMMSSSTYSSVEGIGFAIPSGTIKPVVDALIASGKVTGRPAIGITVGAIPESATDYYDLPEGLYISAVSEGSDAEKKGILVGDILTAVNGVPVSTTYDVSAIKDGLGVGDTLTLTIYRSGETFDVDVTLVETSDIY